MKIMVIGAGVIGSYLCHVLCENGHEVTILARGVRKEELEKKGLVLRHYLQHKRTVDYPRVTGRLDREEAFDAVFAVMQYQQMKEILPDLAGCLCPLVVLVGNNMEAPQMEEYIRRHSPMPKKIVFAFQPTGGRREKGEVICVRFGIAHLSCGFLHSMPDEGTKAVLARIFTGKYQPAYVSDMDGWYKSHLAFILPICYICYTLGCDLTKIRGKQLGLVMDAAGEGYAMLAALGCPVLPEGSEKAFAPGWKRRVSFLMLWIMSKTPLGRLAASDHCKNAVGEMEALDAAFGKLREECPVFSMRAWDLLRSEFPGWEELRRELQ